MSILHHLALWVQSVDGKATAGHHLVSRAVYFHDAREGIRFGDERMRRPESIFIPTSFSPTALVSF